MAICSTGTCSVTSSRYVEGNVSSGARTRSVAGRTNVSAGQTGTTYAPTNPKTGSPYSRNTLVWSSRNGQSTVYSPQNTVDFYSSATVYGTNSAQPVPTTQQKPGFLQQVDRNERTAPESLQQPRRQVVVSRYSTDTNYTACNPIRLTTCSPSFIPSSGNNNPCQGTEYASGVFQSPFG